MGMRPPSVILGIIPEEVAGPPSAQLTATITDGRLMNEVVHERAR
jgi:hypothetical protein